MANLGLASAGFFYPFQMTNKKPKNITLDNLAGMVQWGFLDVDKRFDEVDERFDNVDKKFDNIDKRINGLDNKIDALCLEVSSINKRVETLTSG